MLVYIIQCIPHAGMENIVTSVLSYSVDASSKLCDLPFLSFNDVYIGIYM